MRGRPSPVPQAPRPRRAAWDRARHLLAVTLIGGLIAASLFVVYQDHRRSEVSHALMEEASTQLATFERAGAVARDYVYTAGRAETPATIVGGLRDEIENCARHFTARANRLASLVAALDADKSPDADELVRLLDRRNGAINRRAEIFTRSLWAVAGAEPDQTLGSNEAWLIVDHDTSGQSDLRRLLERSARLASDVDTAVHERAHIHKIVIAAAAVLVAGVVIVVVYRPLLQSIAASRAHVEYVAYHDERTGAPNRRHLERETEKRLAKGGAFSLIFLHLDRFRTVSDALGPSAADELARRTAERLRLGVDKGETFARIDDETFAILIRGDDSETEVRAMRLAQELGRPVSLGQHEVATSLSFGLARAPADGDRFDQLSTAATLAMQEARLTPGTSARVFESKLLRRVVEEQELQRDFRRGLEQGELELFYQPKIWLANGALGGFEALLRWRHPERGLMSPGQFLWAVEQSDLGVELPDFVIETASRQIERWQRAGLVPVDVAVNLDRTAFAAMTPVERLLGRLDSGRLCPGALQIEVTEEVAVDDGERSTLELLERLRLRGVKVALDDFGTGYASLKHLAELPCDVIKLDRSCVSAVDRDAQRAAVLRNVLTLVGELGKVAVAEGIETPGELEWLTSHGCEMGQGFLFAKPLPADRATRLLEAEQRPSVPAAGGSMGIAAA